MIINVKKIDFFFSFPRIRTKDGDRMRVEFIINHHISNLNDTEKPL